jgi:hypothetical protein
MDEAKIPGSSAEADADIDLEVTQPAAYEFLGPFSFAPVAASSATSLSSPSDASVSASSSEASYPLFSLPLSVSAAMAGTNVVVDDSPLQHQMEKNKECK